MEERGGSVDRNSFLFQNRFRGRSPKDLTRTASIQCLLSECYM